MKKVFNRVISILLCTIMVMAIIPAMPVKAATTTPDNPIIFTVRGTVGAGGAIEYHIVVDDVYSGGGMTYQGFTITYPAELTIHYPASLMTTWNLFENTASNPKSINAIIKSGNRTPALLKTDLESIYFTLTTTDVFPPDGSTVTVTATKEKVAFFQDESGYVHYYEWVPFNVVGGVPQAGNNPASGVNKNWWQAYNLAHNKTMQDPRYPDDPSKVLHGYLATITSVEEQLLLYSAIADWSGWLGGTRQVLSSGSAKIQGTASIPEAATSYAFAAAQNKWYWADGPEAWTVYNTSTTGYLAGGPAHQYYPKGMTTVPSDAWSIYNELTHSYTYWGISANQPNVILPEWQTFVPDPNRGKPIVPLVFYNNNIYAAATRYNITGVYSNWNNPQEGTVHVHNSNKELVGTVPGNGAEPNGTSSEYCLQFAYPSGTFTAGGSSTTKPDTWNDYAATNTSNLYGYFIEYGGYLGDPKAEELIGSDVTTSSEVELVMPVVIQYRSTVQNADNTYRQITYLTNQGTPVDRIMSYENSIPYTVVRDLHPAVIGGIPGYTPYGYVFFGQPEDDKLTPNAAGDVSGFYSINMQRIVFLYQPDSYTVTFNANYPGWSSADVSPGSKTVNYDSPYGPLATANRPGYTLEGWYYNAACTGNRVDSSTLVTETDNHTLYAKWSLNNGYRVEYDLNDGDSGDIPPLEAIAWTDANLLPTPPTRSGYIFTGWNVSVNGTKQGVTSSDTYGSLANNDAELFITLQAQWLEENRIMVIYHLNDADTPTLSDLPNGEMFYISDPVGFPAATRAGYSFDGWKVANNGLEIAGNTYPAETEGIIYENIAGQVAAGPPIEYAHFVILEAQWTPKTYTINYEVNDESDYVDPASPQLITSKTSVLWNQNGLVPPAIEGNPTRPHHTFMGWNTEADGSGRIAYVGSTYAQLADGDDSLDEVNLYAQWIKERSYFVRYDTNGGFPASIDDLSPVYIGDDGLIPPTPPTPPLGYDFAGWKVTYNGTKMGVTDSDTFGSLASDPNLGYIVLTAQYAPKGNFTVIYNLNGHTQSGYPTQKPANPPPGGEEPFVVWTQNKLLPNADPVRTGYTFLGWNTASDGTGLSVTNADTYGVLANGNDTSPGSITLYAQWSLIEPEKYTVRYNLNGGQQPTTPIIDVVLQGAGAFNFIVPAPAPIPPVGYDFDRWIVEDNGYGQGTTMSPNGSSVRYSDLAYSVDSKAIVLKARYVEKSNFEVIYDWNYTDAPKPPSGSSVDSVKWTQSGFLPYTWNDNGTTRPAYRPGYTLLGWTTDPAGTGTYVMNSTPYKTLSGGDDTTTSVTLYAQWEVAYFYVRYDTNGANPPAGTIGDYQERTVGFDDIGLVPPSFERIGYTLAGWNVSENGFKQGVTQADSYRTLANPGAPYITLQAQWVAKDYTVYYDLNGGTTTISPPNSAPGAVKWWSTNLLPASTEVSRKGYTFDGWKLSKVGNMGKTPAEIETANFLNENIKYSDLAYVASTGIDTESITIQAQWTPNYHYKVYYDLNDSISAPAAPASIDPLEALGWNNYNLLPTDINGLITPTRPDGWKFLGWKLSKIDEYSIDPIQIGTSNFVVPSNTYGSLAVNDVNNITLQAQWEKTDGYSVYYNLDGGSAVPDISNIIGIVNGTDTNLIPVSVITKTGYNFSHWELVFRGATEVSPTVIVSNSDSFNTLANGESEITLKAVYTEKPGVPITYTAVTKDEVVGTTGGTVTPTTEDVNPETGTPSSTAAVNAGYEFIGWFARGDNYDVDTPISTSLTFIPPQSGGLNVAGNYVAYFKELDHVTISYTAATKDEAVGTTGGFVTITYQSVNPETGIPSSTATLNTGYEFVGWFKLGDNYDTDTPLSTNLIFSPPKYGGLNVSGDYVAYFKELEHVAITYTAITKDEAVGTTGGTVTPTTEAVNPETGMPSSIATVNAGYEFVGWFALGSDYDADTPLSTNLTFTPPLSGGLNVAGDYVAYFRELGHVTITYTAMTKDESVGTTGGSVTPPTQAVNPETGTPSSTATVNPGYEFIGWFALGSDYDADTPISTNLTFTPPQSGGLNVTGDYVAYFRELGHVTITYSAVTKDELVGTTGGTVTPTIQDVNPETGTPSSTASVNAGYEFVGWFVLGSAYDVDTPISTSLIFTPPQSGGLNMTGDYVAYFRELSSTLITYTAINANAEDTNDSFGSVTPPSQLIAPVTGVASSTATSGPGYHFDGWYEASDTTFSNKLSSNETFTPAKVGGLNVAGDYVALFVEDSGVIINYAPKTLDSLNDEEGGSVNPTSQTVAPVTGTASATATVNPGYHLVGWFDAVDTNYEYNLSTELTFSPDRISGLNVAGSYVALFDEDTDVTITYAPKTNNSVIDDEGGCISSTFEAVSPATGNPSATAVANSGYHLVGWFSASDTGYEICLGTEETFYPPKTNNLNVEGSYVALFAEDSEITITYTAKTVGSAIGTAGGTVGPNTQSVAPVTGSASSTATVKNGYHFIGWFAASDEEYETVLTTNLTFYPTKVGGLNVTSDYVALFEENSDVTISYAPKTKNSTTDDVGGTVSPANQSVAPATGTASATATPTKGYRLVGWYVATDVGYKTRLGTTATFTPPKVDGINVEGSYVALFEKIPSNPGTGSDNNNNNETPKPSTEPEPTPSEKVTVTFNSDSILLNTSTLPSGQNLGGQMADIPSREGYTFVGWNTEPDASGEWFTGSTTVLENTKVYSIWKKKVDSDVFAKEHFAYVLGYPDGTVKPQANITREEIAAILFRLLDDDVRNEYWTDSTSYSDVTGRWSNIEISTISNMGVLLGYPDGTFKPEKSMTRAEFAAMAMRFFNTESTTATSRFSDINGHWAEKFIIQAYECGIINGYPDGTFNPDGNITRAEAMKIINSLTGRCEIHSTSNLSNGMKTWSDNQDTNAWYYFVVQEATNSHDYEIKEGAWTWPRLREDRDWNSIKYR